MTYKFLLYVSYSYGIPIGRPLDEEIKKRGYEVRWFTYIENTKKYIPEDSVVIDLIGDVIEYNPDIILAIADYVPDFLQGLKVQIFHGFNPDKRPNDEHFTIRGFFDLYCTQGPSTTTGFKKAQKRNPHFEVIETGWPKMDSLFKNPVTYHNTLPVVLITSTFSRRLSLALRDDVLEAIEGLSRSGKYDFIAVLHPKLPDATIQKWKALQNEHFTYLDTTELNPLFLKADVMLSDTTSAVQEFMLTHKPIVTFNHRKPDSSFVNVEEAGKIGTALDYALTRPAVLIEAIKKKAFENHPYRDGQSSARVIDAVIQFLHSGKSHLKKKPVNLIRKYKVRKQLRYFTLKSYRKPACK